MVLRQHEFDNNLAIDWAKLKSNMNYKNTVLSQNEKDRWSKTPAGQFQGWKDFLKIAGIPENEINTFTTKNQYKKSSCCCLLKNIITGV